MNDPTLNAEPQTAVADDRLIKLHVPAAEQPPVDVPQPVALNPQLAITPLVPQLSAVTPEPSKRKRNGKIARLPKPQRDMVNRMLFNNVPYLKIVRALRDCDIQVTERNISNWKTRGGYREWRLAQEFALQLQLRQDNLVDLIRRNDASDIPEVGLQAVATQLSQFLLAPAAAQLLASNPAEYQRLVAMLNSVAVQLRATQKYRDDSAKALSYKHDPERIRRQTEEEIEQLRRVYSAPQIPKNIDEPLVPHRNYVPKS